MTSQILLGFPSDVLSSALKPWESCQPKVSLSGADLCPHLERKVQNQPAALVLEVGMVETERPLVLIKDNGQPCEELSFSLRLRQKGSVSPQELSLFELAGGAKTRRPASSAGLR